MTVKHTSTETAERLRNGRPDVSRVLLTLLTNRSQATKTCTNPLEVYCSNCTQTGRRAQVENIGLRVRKIK